MKTTKPTRSYYVRSFNQSYKEQERFTNKKDAVRFAKELSKKTGLSVDVYIGIMNYLRFYWFGKEKAVYQYSCTGNWFTVDNKTLKLIY
jgi:hypothetical protein